MARPKDRFQFTPVLRRATSRTQTESPSTARFNSRPSCDGRRRRAQVCASAAFQFTPVLRRATTATADNIVLDKFQFTPVLRRATRSHAPYSRRTTRFNSRPSCDGRPIHSPQGAPGAVSIHARLATGDARSRPSATTEAFQFTPVLRRATVRWTFPWRKSEFQFTPVLRRATFLVPLLHLEGLTFQFTPVLRRATTSARTPHKISCFNSRPSCDGRLL